MNSRKLMVLDRGVHGISQQKVQWCSSSFPLQRLAVGETQGLARLWCSGLYHQTTKSLHYPKCLLQDASHPHHFFSLGKATEGPAGATRGGLGTRHRGAAPQRAGARADSATFVYQRNVPGDVQVCRQLNNYYIAYKLLDPLTWLLQASSDALLLC